MDAVEVWKTIFGGKMRLQRVIFLISVLIMLAVGCTQPTASAETPPRPPTLIAGSATPSPIPTTTTFPTLTATPTVLPTLPVGEARIKLLDLLANNGNCRLPCLWGLTPGKSSTQEARAVLSPLSSLSGFTGFESGIGTISPEFTDDDFSIYTMLNFLADPKSNIISHISFQVEAHKKYLDGGYEDIFDSKFFGERVEYYMLPHILTEQGIPSAVIISTLAGQPTRGSRSGFWMILFYPDQGILVYYTTSWQMTGNNVVGCFSNAHVEFELYPSGHADSFSEYLAQTQFVNLWPVPANSPNWKPIEKATTMSLEEFYQTFSQPTEKCIETPANLWPVPEP
jgi:hypothetical protein